jgi:hypothetical protein
MDVFSQENLMRWNWLAVWLGIAAGLSGCLRLDYRADPGKADFCLAKDKPAAAQAPPAETAPAAVEGEGHTSFWHRADLRTADLRSRMAKWRQHTQDHIETVMDSSLAKCAIFPVAVAAYVCACMQGHGGELHWPASQSE